jgi:hypothetical protein
MDELKLYAFLSYLENQDLFICHKSKGRISDTYLQLLIANFKKTQESEWMTAHPE